MCEGDWVTVGGRVGVRVRVRVKVGGEGESEAEWVGESARE